jgi:DinB superfamily
MPHTRQALIDRYRDGYRAVTDALEGITDAELDARPAPNKWTARQIVHHLADSEMTSAIRLRRLLAEDQPLIVGYDQEEFARRLYYDRPIAASLAAFEAARASTAELLERMTESEWARTGTHSESGAYTATRWLEIYAAHAHDHADQIRRARATLTKGASAGS